MDELTCDDFSCSAERMGDGSAIVAISGELDMHNADEVNRVLDALKQRGSSDHLVIDLTDCVFIDSIGLSVLIAGQHAARSPLHIVVTGKALRRVLSVTGLSSLFKLHETRAEAMEALRRRVGTA